LKLKFNRYFRPFTKKLKMKIALFLTMFLSAGALMAQDLVILHTNDMHSHQIGFAPEMEYTPLVADNDPTQGGFARIAGFIKT